MFAFADGAGLMGEAGPEAIMPLSRDGSGRLGVALHGSTSPSAINAAGGSSEVLVKLSPELVGEILKQAQGQTVKIVAQESKQRSEFYRVGGNPNG
jgi:phage-related minor tail protein